MQSQHNEMIEMNPCEALVNAIVKVKLIGETDTEYVFGLDFGQKANVSRGEFRKKPEEGEEVEILICYRSTDDSWVASRIQAQNLRLWDHVEGAAKAEEKIDALIVAHNQHGLIADVFGLRGFIPRSQVACYEVEDIASYVGKTVQCKIVKFDRKDANIIVSIRALEELEMLEKREELLRDLQVDQEYDAVIRRVVDYGVFVDIGYGVEGLVHKSNLSWAHTNPMEQFKAGDEIRVKVLKINQDGKIDLGRKQLIEDPWHGYVGGIQLGDIVKGRVMTLTNFGAFVELAPEVDSLIHITEMSWNERIRHPKQILQPSQEVEAKVIGIDPDSRRIKLSLKQMVENPWIAISEKYPSGTKLCLPIIGKADFGLFVTIEPGFDGLIHATDIQWDAPDTRRVLEQYEVGSEIDCVVLTVDTENSRASLGIKQLTDDPWTNVDSIAPLGKHVPVTVKRVTNFGAFVELAPQIEGLIHISELSDSRVRDVTEVVLPGDQVEATVISLDKKRRRIGLSLIQEEFTPKTIEDDEDDAIDDESENATLGDIFPEDLK